MMDPSEWQTFKRAIDDLARVLYLPFGSWAIFMLRQILAQLRTLNGRVTKQETWTGTHDKADEAHFSAVHHELETIDSRITHLRDDFTQCAISNSKGHEK